MDSKRVGPQFGRLLAEGSIAHTLSVEASITHSLISPTPVLLEPAFYPFDPAQSFVKTGQRRCAIRAVPSPEWAVRRIILPALDRIDLDCAAGFLARLAGCTAPMSFAVLAHRERAAAYVGALVEHIAFVSSAWLATYPESAVVAAPNPWSALHGALVLCDLFADAPYHRRVRASVSLWPQLLRLAANVHNEDDVVFLQVLFTPAQFPWQQNIAGMLAAERTLGSRAPLGQTADAKDPSDPLFCAAIRIGSTDGALAESIGALCGIFTSDGKPFGYRTQDDYRSALGDDSLRGMVQRHESHVTGQLLSVGELAQLIHPPDHSCAGILALDIIAGLPVPQSLRGPGNRPLGVNTRSGVPVTVHMPVQYNKSTLVIGRSGSGKTAALIHAIVHLALQGEGVGLLDPHGTGADALLGALGGVAPERIEYWDFDATDPVAFNAFAYPHEHEHGRVGAEYGHAFQHLCGAEGYYRMLHILVNGICGLLAVGENLAALPILLGRGSDGEALRQRVISTTQNPAVVRFFTNEFLRFGPEAVAPILNRISPLLLDERTYRIFSQRENKVDLATAMDQRKVVIIKTPANTAAASLVGGLVIAQARMAALHRSITSRATHFQFFIDEFHRYISSEELLQSIIDETTKFGLSVTLAHQETGQVPADLLKALYSMPNTFVFNVNLPDAKHLAHLFDARVTPETLASQPVGHVYARIGQEIVSFQSPPPLPSNPEIAARIIAASRQRYSAQPTATPVRRRGPRNIETF